MIPGVATFHPRESWQSSKFPVFGPLSDVSNIDTAVIHYTAADNLIDGDPGEHAENLPAYIRAMQYHYVTARGYSLGYWFAVDWLGGVWQIRGFEFKSAANAGHNETTCPILLLVDGNDMASPYAVASVRAIVAEAGRLAGRRLKIKGHGQLRAETGVGTATACPGHGLQAQINAGVFTPRPVVSPPLELIDMTLKDYFVVTFPTLESGAYLVGPGGVIHLTAEMRDAYVRGGARRVESNNADVLASYKRVARGL